MTDHPKTTGPLLNTLQPAALSAAIMGGTEGWGRYGSAASHVRYLGPTENKRSRCRCGCKGAAQVQMNLRALAFLPIQRKRRPTIPG